MELRVEHSPSMHKALHLTPSIGRRQKEDDNNKEKSSTNH
jgi:hypothetical protein